MKLKKIISSGLALCLIFNNTSLSLANVISEDGRYETFEGNNITIDNVLEEDKVDVEIEGNTMVNLVSMPSVKSKNVTVAEERATILSDFTNKYNIKPNTEYTYFMEVRVTNATENFVTSVNLDYVTSEGIHVYHSTIDKIRLIGNGQCLFKLKFTTGNDVSHFFNFFATARSSDGNTVTGTHEVLSMILLEGDYIDNDLSYFEGMKSVGQDDTNNHNIKVASINKNLLPTLSLDTDNEGYANREMAVWEFVKLKPNTKYTLSYIGKASNYTNHQMWPFWVDEQTTKKSIMSNQIINSSTVDVSMSFTTSSSEYYRIRLIPNNADYVGSYLFKPSTVILEEGERSSYTTQVVNKLDIHLSEPLRGLPSGIKDKIVKRNGQWMVERKVGKVILDDASNVAEVYADGDSFTQFNINFNEHNLNNWECITENFINVRFTNTIDSEAIAMHHQKLIVLKIKNSKARTKEELDVWLRNNPIEALYELATPIYEPININTAVILYEETTHISNNSNIPTNMKVVIDRAINRAMEAIQIAKENPTIENISQARYWANLMKETIKKDEVNNQINDITTPVDLNIEKKKASANVDVYVKSNNSLSMTLSTNSITFDKYTGTDDIEKNSALEITVHSSLPYDLNAYLEENIQNLDKSVVMDSNLLQIKESSDIDYKSFASINDKIVLTENNSYGNYNKHSIDLKMEGSNAYKADIYKTTIKFEAQQK